MYKIPLALIAHERLYGELSDFSRRAFIIALAQPVLSMSHQLTLRECGVDKSLIHLSGDETAQAILNNFNASFDVWLAFDSVSRAIKAVKPNVVCTCGYPYVTELNGNVVCAQCWRLRSKKACECHYSTITQINGEFFCARCGGAVQERRHAFGG